jgi:hypothetical protein
MHEKRKTVRRSLAPDDLIIVEINGKEKVARVIDVSEGGMRIRVPEVLSMGTEVFCKIDMRRQETPPFYAQGPVIRVSEEKNQCEAAIKFDTVRIYNFLKIKEE